MSPLLPFYFFLLSPLLPGGFPAFNHRRHWCWTLAAGSSGRDPLPSHKSAVHALPWRPHPTCFPLGGAIGQTIACPRLRRRGAAAPCSAGRRAAGLLPLSHHAQRKGRPHQQGWRPEGPRLSCAGYMAPVHMHRLHFAHSSCPERGRGWENSRWDCLGRGRGDHTRKGVPGARLGYQGPAHAAPRTQPCVWAHPPPRLAPLRPRPHNPTPCLTLHWTRRHCVRGSRATSGGGCGCARPAGKNAPRRALAQPGIAPREPGALSCGGPEATAAGTQEGVPCTGVGGGEGGGNKAIGATPPSSAPFASVQMAP